ncbi:MULTISPECIES: hypothetical protein [unclassified Streptomyces]|uniref:hypothetical protein n=1 Tax=unclassified Streptomyces TaxID=2593676 RepID=UPI00224E002A|nr:MULTISPECIES: hypothetical protein [unclassified Streptomyces]MCX4526843.1 hypothetical protein [Streptomyces sp. NBC_01551]MCX4542597.1 hypothetical protein [Streptomyces sp. NBC_01565]
MTPTTGTIRHPDVSEISDLTEGLLSPVRTAEVRRHLGDCVLCADVRASLEEIRALLGTLPGPPRIPADIAGRIDAALAAEALLDATTPRDEQTPAARDDRSADSPEAPPAAAGGGTPAAPPTAGAGSGGQRPAGHPVGATGPGRRRARRRIAIVTGLAGAAAFALAVFLLNGPTGTPSHDTATRGRTESSAAAQPSTDTYTSEGLRSSVQHLLANSESPKAATSEGNSTYGLENTSPAPGVAPQDRRAASVPPCVQDATGRPETPLATERGSYQGAPVYLLVLPHPGDPARVDAYLVGAGCADTPTRAPGKPLLTSTYPRS